MRDDRKSATRIHPDFYFGLVLLLIGGALLWHTTSDRYDYDPLFDDVSTVYFPRIILVLWVVLSAVLIARGLLGRGSEEDRLRLMSVGLPQLLMVLGVIIASAVVLWSVGLLIGGPVLMVAVGVALGYRRWLYLVPLSVALPIAIWFTLGKIAEISLPSGILWD